MSYSQFDLATLDQQLIDRLDQAELYDSADRREAINVGIQVLGMLTGVWKIRVPIQLQPGSDPYVALPSTVMSPTRVECGGRALAPASLAGLDQLRATWEGETVADGGAVPARVLAWAPAGGYLIAIWPAVAATWATGIVVEGAQMPPILVNQGDYLNLSQDQASAVLDCAVAMLAFDQGGEVLTAAYGRLKAFLQQAGVLNERIQASAVYREIMAIDRARAARVARAALSVNPALAGGSPSDADQTAGEG